jgi:peptidylprolyl isomerase
MFNKSLAFALALLAAPAFAEGDGPGPNLVIDITGAANGQVVIDLAADVAPKHVAQILALAKSGAYDGVVFHRVIEGFMAQTGDVEFGKMGGDLSSAGMGGSELPDIPAEFSDISFQRGVVGMARSGDPKCVAVPDCVEGEQFLNSANSQFFIMFAPGTFLDGQYTVVGKVISGMEVVDAIQLGDGQNGEVTNPDVMAKVTVQE